MTFDISEVLKNSRKNTKPDAIPHGKYFCKYLFYPENTEKHRHVESALTSGQCSRVGNKCEQVLERMMVLLMFPFFPARHNSSKALKWIPCVWRHDILRTVLQKLGREL